MKTLNPKFTLISALMALLLVAPQFAVAQLMPDGQFMDFTDYYDDEPDLNPADINPQAPSLVIKPQPVSGAYMEIWFAQIEQQAEITLLDLNGKVYHQAMLKVSPIGEGNYKLPVTSLAAGIYLLRVSSHHLQTSRKVIIR